MTNEQAIGLMCNEITCINTAERYGCGCKGCHLVRNTDDLLEAYKLAVEALQTVERIPEVIKWFEDRISYLESIDLSEPPLINEFMAMKEAMDIIKEKLLDAPDKESLDWKMKNCCCMPKDGESV